MSVPFYANLIVGGTVLYLFYRDGFRLDGISDAAQLSTGPVAAVEYRAGAIVANDGPLVVYRLCPRAASGGAGVDCPHPDFAAPRRHPRLGGV